MPRFSIRASGANDLTELRIYGDIGPSWWEPESLDAKSIVEKLDGITGALAVRINSFGGSVADGLAIFNALRRHKGPVTCHIDGVAYSIASLIAMAGSEICIAANALLMIHAPWGTALGNAAEMRDMADILDKHAEAMVSSYLRAGGPDEATIRGWLTDGQDHYFTATEALSWGLADTVSAPQETTIAAALREASNRYRIPAAERRTTQEGEMPELTQGTPAGAETTDIVMRHSATVKRAQAEGVKLEAKRRGEISTVFADFYDADPLNPITALHDECMDDTKCDELTARRRLLAYLANASEHPILARETYAIQPSPQAPPRASRHLGGALLITQDQQDKRASGLIAAMKVKAGLTTDRAAVDAERRGEFLALSLSDIMAQELRGAGYPQGGTREDIARAYVRALPILAAGPSHGTDALPAVLGNIANLSAMQGWDASEETWPVWTQSGVLNNYQTATRANLALLDKLTQMAENQQWEYGGLADVRQRITGYFHGLKYALSIQAIVNDDLGELARAMQGWGEAAKATVGDAIHVILFAAGSGGYGQSMDEDSTILFHASHGNYVASGSGAVPSETTINTARTAMAARTDPNGRTVGIRPKYLIHGPGIYATVRKALESQDLQSVTVDGTTGATVLTGSTNAIKSMNLIPVEEYRIVSGHPGANTWLLAAGRRHGDPPGAAVPDL